MSVDLITLVEVKQHLRVSADDMDGMIQELIDSSVVQAEDYLNKKVYDTQENLDIALEDGADPDRIMLINKAFNQAVALLVEYQYDGVSSLGAEKIEAAAYKVLQPYRFLVGW